MAVSSAACINLAVLAQQRRRDAVQTEQASMQVVNKAFVEANSTIEAAKKMVAASEAKSQHLANSTIQAAKKMVAASEAESQHLANSTIEDAKKMIAASEAKSQQLTASTKRVAEKEILAINLQVNKTIEILKNNIRSSQSDCTLQASAVVKAEEKILHLKQLHAIKLKSLKVKHKRAFRSTRALHAARSAKQRCHATNELNRLRELLYGQNLMIDGALEEMLDERRDARQAVRLLTNSAEALKSLASDRLSKIKLWKRKCDDLYLLKDAYTKQSGEMVEMQQKIKEYEILTEEMTEDYESTILTMCPRLIEKNRVKNRTNKYGHQEWMPFIDKLIIELLCDRVPPTCIQLALVSVTKGEQTTCIHMFLILLSLHCILTLLSTVVFPNHNVIRELPSLRHIRMCRTVLLRTTKTLAAYRLGNATSWKQLHTDETGRQQKQLVNVVINIVNEGGDFKSICLSGSIIAEDSTAEEQSRAIIASFSEAGQLLQEWTQVTIDMFPKRQDLANMIPDPSHMCPTKLLGGMISTDTCNTARKTRQTLSNHIIQMGRDRGFNDEALVLYQGNCHQHLRNILVDAAVDHLSSKLSQLLCEDLAIIPTHLRVTCKISDILCARDKEFNFTANYAKGHGGMFHAWMETFRPGCLFVPVVRVLNGNRQDASFEGAFPLYVGRSHMVAFLNERLCAGMSVTVCVIKLHIQMPSHVFFFSRCF
jgi:hypothetical protein